MPGSATPLVNPAVPNNTEVDTLLIEKFNGKTHECYQKGENLLSDFTVEQAVGTNMVSDKYVGETSLQTLTPGQEPVPGEVEFSKNAVIVDTIVLGRNTMHDLHNIQSDIKVMDKLANNQSGKIKSLEDQMVVQQMLKGGLTGGSYDPFANTITGGTSRVAGQGVAINVDLKNDLSQAKDPYQLVSAIETAIMGLVAQRVPLVGMKIIVPLTEYGLLVDYNYIATSNGGENEVSAIGISGMTGTLKGYGLPIIGSVEFTQMIMNPHGGATHHLLSNATNGNRYDVTDPMKKCHACIYTSDALLCGRTIGLSTDIFYNKEKKCFYIDTWNAQAATVGRYDNIAIVGSNAVANNDVVLAKAKGKATATKAYS